jgi:AraC family transcriptional regulator, regulatory protein of adaptative response / methylated-DNA-[protein]-cysteine methyltransferase
MAGSTPRAFRPRVDHTHETLRYATAETTLGFALAAVSEIGLIWSGLSASSESALRALRRRFPEAHLVPAKGEPLKIAKAIAAFIDKQKPIPDFVLDLRGGELDVTIWRAAMQAPFGETRAYSDIARLIGKPRAARAVGKAMAVCDLFPIVPCHRIRRADGGLSGDPAWVKLQKIMIERERDAVR